jgi:DNA-damage-inducible protein D
MAKKKEISKLAVFEGQEIRRIIVDDEWYYSVVDVVAALTDSNNPRSYWSKLKERELESEVQLSTICLQLKVKSSDGKKYLTDCTDNEGLFRIIQSIPSKKAEPFKRWLAKLGKERLEEIEQPGKAIERAKNYYILKGYNKQWVETRTAGIEMRHEFTDALKSKKIKDKEYGILTNEMYRSTFGMGAIEYKNYKELSRTDSLRDNMTPLELAATIFSEATATEFLEQTEAKGFFVTRDYILKAGNITQEAIRKIEKQTGKKVITKQNYKSLNLPAKQKEIIRKSLKELESHSGNLDAESTDIDKP